MRNFGFTLVAAAGMALGFSAPASAITFGGTYVPSSPVETCSDRTSGGVGICFSQIQTLNFDLINSGDSTLLDLFTVSIYDEIDHPDDLQTADIQVYFDFTDPGLANGTVYGGVTGQFTWSNLPDLRSLLIEWDDPISLDFGDGTLLSILLLPLEIECGWECVEIGWEYVDDGHGGKKWKRNHKKRKKIPVYQHDSGIVQAKFKLESAPGNVPEIPLPTTLPLMMSGLVGFAYLGYRRRRAA